MKLKLINLFLLLFIYHQNVSASGADDILKSNSLIRKIKSNRGSFQSDIQIIELNGTKTIIKEQYSFSEESGRYERIVTSKDGKINLHENAIYIDKLNELHEVNHLEKTCSFETLPKETKLKLHLSKWSPLEAIDIPLNFKILSPSHLLFALIDFYDKNKNKNLIKCERLTIAKKLRPVRCDVVFKNTAKIEYYFETKDTYPMFPYKIKTFENIAKTWKLFKEIDYVKFEYAFSGKKYHNNNLPIGHSCRHDFRLHNKYPIKETNYGKLFTLDFDIEYNYLNMMNKKKESYLTKKYSNKMFVDHDNQLYIVDGVDEKTNKKIKTFYDTNTYLANEKIPDEEKCTIYNFKPQSNYKMNWFYVQDLYLLSKKMFYANHGKELNARVFSYLGNHQIDGKSYNVFEASFNYEQNNLLETISRNNLNKIEAKRAIVTHFYPSNSQANVPSSIEIRLRDQKNKEISTIKIKIKNHRIFNTADYLRYKSENSLDFNECYESLDSKNYRWMEIQFKSNSKLIKDYNENYINNEFRNLLLKTNISPIRISDIDTSISSKSEYDLFNITFKLIDPFNSEIYFEKNENLILDDQVRKDDKHEIQIIENIIDDEFCARTCLETKNCVSYSFNEKIQKSICRLWIEYSFSDKIDWKKLKVKKEKNAIIGRRLIKFNEREHLSVKEVYNSIEKLNNLNKFNFILKKRKFDGTYIEVKFEPTIIDIEPEKDRRQKRDNDGGGDNGDNDEDEKKKKPKSHIFRNVSISLVSILLAISVAFGCYKYRDEILINTHNFINRSKN